ncbi:hypothetical protein [Candidatus Protochlamydia phocaeensis]|uniref:hypothetical protein n=1 Tax=Candidatus Protochlamydia phocaeensis TaxID=1414722 RepID=UPI000837D91A|nr:hypothetical protein [Candidatus Protochlamydia phocaeensis]
MQSLMRLFCLFSLLVVPLFAQEVDLSLYEKRVYAQNGEDGVLEQIFRLIPPVCKYYVDFGAGDGNLISNTKYLREMDGWRGLLLDADCEPNPLLNLHREFITAENICEIFAKYTVPTEFDLISIDIDYNDFYVWKALSSRYHPRVVVIEFNCSHNYDEDKVVKYDPDGFWDISDYYGASMLALYRLGRVLGYSLVYQDANAVNLFFIRDDVLEETGIKFKNMNDVAKLYNIPPHRLARNGYRPGNPFDPLHREFISSEEALQLVP